MRLASVVKALYSIPHPYVGQVLTARADQQLVRFYARGLLIKTHARQPPGGRSIDPDDYPVERSVYALRNVDALRRQAANVGEAIGLFAAALLDSPLPWTRMRRVYALLSLVRRYGAARVHEVCVTALAVPGLAQGQEHQAVPSDLTLRVKLAWPRPSSAKSGWT